MDHDLLSAQLDEDPQQAWTDKDDEPALPGIDAGLRAVRDRRTQPLHEVWCLVEQWRSGSKSPNPR